VSDRSAFEAIYRNAGRNADSIPWASLTPSPLVENWLSEQSGSPGAAVVVACGLGDDAEALAAQGWHVTAFDVAPTALAWAGERFPESTVNYVVADLFDLPRAWSQAFTLVVEVFTIQSITPHVRVRVIRAIADLVAPGGTLLVAAIGHDGDRISNGPPWPLIREDLRAFPMAGLEEVAFSTRPSSWPGFEHFEVEYRRPELAGSIVK
jgi:2-polyprenyl-3-methyl-5-hydroxy-6-metoxy-1,4-benzoquinol methylase